MSFLQQPISWPFVKVAIDERGQQRMKNHRDISIDLQNFHRYQEDDTNLTMMWSELVTNDEEL
jgi:hypothetical protein